LLFVAAIAALPTGCGTVVNLRSPPPAQAHPGIGPTACTPFGGVLRSGLLGGFGLVCGVFGGWSEIGNGGLLQGAALAGMGVLAVADTPLSLVGDVVTLPIAAARAREAAWATWWGDQGKKGATVQTPEGSTPGPDGAAQPSEGPPRQEAEPAVGSPAASPGLAPTPAPGPPAARLGSPTAERR
jgi:hypothetical protein